jgi:shikimate dehydrogenase
VLGSPIAHSQSPALHLAAYRALNLDWAYQAIEVTGEQLPKFVQSRGPGWRGLSLTMPLKRDVLPLLSRVDDLVSATGSANTLVFDRSTAPTQLVGFNTDVFGISEAFRSRGHRSLESVVILGGGATAASAVAAAAELGASGIDAYVRAPSRASQLVDVGARVSVAVSIHGMAELRQRTESASAVISTLPNGADPEVPVPEPLSSSAVLIDVAYHPWPSALARRWEGDVISGIEMLVLQALMQVRIFVTGEPAIELSEEGAVLAAMRSAVGL